MKYTQERNPSGTLMIFEGPRDEVQDCIVDVMERYHPIGYGTYVKETKTLPKESLRAVIWRANSCD
jgi:hypothetical protein